MQMKEIACTPSLQYDHTAYQEFVSHHRLWIQTMITRTVFFSLSDEAAFYISG